MLRETLLLTAVAATGLLSSCQDSAVSRAQAAQAPSPAADTTALVETAADAPVQYTDLLSYLDGRIVNLSRRAEEHSGEWLPLQDLAEAFRQRAGLSGSWTDYAQCEEAVEKAIALAPLGSGPLMTRARMNYSLHRLPEVRADLDTIGKRAIETGSVQRDLALLKADLAYQSGDYDAALAGYRAAAGWDQSGAALTRLAEYHWHTGGFAEAEALFHHALELSSKGDAQGRAWIHLQLGLLNLDRGRLDEALAEYEQGSEVVAGWWLLDEHKAEIHALKGNHEEALNRYTELVQRTGNPEFMDALAGVYAAMGDEARSRQWIAKAGSEWELRLAQFPEAAYGHALGHYIDLGSDAARAVELAKSNYDLRPNGEAHVLLAEAYLKADQPELAYNIVADALAGPYRSADLHAVAAEALTGMGRRDEAARQQETAAAISLQRQ